MPASAVNSGATQSSARARSANAHSEIEFRERACDALAIRDERQQILQQRVVQRAFAGEGAFLRGERLVLERLQLRRDVALGVLQRLTAAIVVGNLVGLPARDFDIEAVHLVVFDTQIRDARARALARFEIDQELIAVLRNIAQLVEIRIVAARDHAAVANQRGGLGRDGVRQQIETLVRRLQRGADALQRQRMRGHGRDERAQVGQRGEGIAQARQIARPRRQQREAARDALDVRDLAQRAAQRVEAAARRARRAMRRSPAGAPAQSTASRGG